MGFASGTLHIIRCGESLIKLYEIPEVGAVDRSRDLGVRIGFSYVTIHVEDVYGCIERLTAHDVRIAAGSAHFHLGAGGAADDPDVSPMLAQDLDLLPPTVIVTASHDPLHDEAKHYSGLLDRAGVPTRLKCFEGAIHAFLSFGVLEIAQRGRAYLADEIRQRPGPVGRGPQESWPHLSRDAHKSRPARGRFTVKLRLGAFPEKMKPP